MRRLGSTGPTTHPAGFPGVATAANAFDHSVKRRVLAIDWIVRITRQVLLRGHLIGPRLAVADRCLRQQLLVPKPHVSFRCSKRAGFGPAL
jgi:hypothetical protein